ncbi:arylamine N-acetyltransferase [Pendulispora brunnea]|uniref:Arylamine N-acetyltransferase n=1 Tax=Pendulispora brunnea TaxID=2905690 RepID=A0ABZ2JZS5_9BACT
MASNSIDLDAYFQRIGYTGPRAPTLETLRALHLAHPQAIAFENIDPFLHRPVRLDPESLQQKLVVERRGGYCYEQNTLFRHVLETLGFHVTSYAARVLWGRNEDGVITPRSHMLLCVALKEGEYLADVGFGGTTLTGPLPFQPNIEVPTPHEHFRLRPTDDVMGVGFILDVRTGNEWRRVYRFDRTPQFVQDYEISSWYLCTHPKSHFLSTFMVARPQPGKRYALRNNELAIHHLDRPSERRTLTSAAELRATLEGNFGIQLPDSPDLEPALQRLVTAANAEKPAG